MILNDFKVYCSESRLNLDYVLYATKHHMTCVYARVTSLGNGNAEHCLQYSLTRMVYGEYWDAQ